MYKSARDSRNTVMWQPSNKTLRNVEVDEAGKLAAFRERYGTGWDLAAPPPSVEEAQAAAAAEGVEGAAPAEKEPEDPFDSLVDLISEYATADKSTHGGISAKEQARMDRKKK